LFADLGVQLLWLSKTSNQNFEFEALKEETADLIFIKEIIEYQ